MTISHFLFDLEQRRRFPLHGTRCAHFLMARRLPAYKCPVIGCSERSRPKLQERQEQFDDQNARDENGTGRKTREYADGIRWRLDRLCGEDKGPYSWGRK